MRKQAAVRTISPVALSCSVTCTGRTVSRPLLSSWPALFCATVLCESKPPLTGTADSSELLNTFSAHGTVTLSCGRK